MERPLTMNGIRIFVIALTLLALSNADAAKTDVVVLANGKSRSGARRLQDAIVKALAGA